jgi:ribosomal-protein-alanine N-acetyltransferase
LEAQVRINYSEFVVTPTLSASRLTLRPLVAASQRQVDWLRDEEIVRYSEQRHLQHTLSTQANYIKSFVGKSHIWGVHLIDSGKHIGNVTARCDEPNDVADMGIMIGDAQCWGKGYGTEAWRAACDWMLERDGGDVRKLEAGCMKANTAMLAIFRKSKFAFECERPSHFLLGGNPVSAMLYGRVR